MSFRRRGSLEISLDIIMGAIQSINKTRLMNKSNLAYASFIKHANFLENKGFITKIPPPPVTHNRRKNRTVKFHYIVTSKGIELIKQIRKFPFSEFLSYRDFDIMEEISK